MDLEEYDIIMNYCLKLFDKSYFKICSYDPALGVIYDVYQSDDISSKEKTIYIGAIVFKGDKCVVDLQYAKMLNLADPHFLEKLTLLTQTWRVKC